MKEVSLILKHGVEAKNYDDASDIARCLTLHALLPFTSSSYVTLSKLVINAYCGLGLGSETFSMG